MIIRLVALITLLAVSTISSAQSVRYIHTDALGSSVAASNSRGQVIERREYEPYGAQLLPGLSDGPGYTGHVQDAATGLTYMQQRYYDPRIGRFLSVDPVTADSIGGNFNRYWYANNSPYKFTDPDGRYICATGKGSGSPCSVAQAATVDRGMSDMQAAAATYRPGSAERAIMDRTVAFYGKAGEDNGVTVRVDSSMASSGSAVTKNGKTVVSVNPQASKLASNGNHGVERADFAATLVHEGNHGIEQQRFGMPENSTVENWGEKRASGAEALLFKGLGQNAPSGVWTSATGINASAIQRQADSSTGYWCLNGGNC